MRRRGRPPCAPAARAPLASERKPYLLRIDPRLFDALQRWARDDLRSVNAQIEFLLRLALAKAGRDPRDDDDMRPPDDAAKP